MTLITKKYLMSKIDEYNHALRQDPEKASVLRQEGLRNIKKYVDEYYLTKHDKRDFDLVYSEETYHMMRTYVRVFGTLTSKVSVADSFDISYSDVLDKIENDYPPNRKNPYWKDKSSQFYYNKSKRAYKRYLSRWGEGCKITHSQNKSSQSHSSKIDVTALLKEDFGVDKPPFMSRIKERLSSLFVSFSNKRKKFKLQNIRAKWQKTKHRSHNTASNFFKKYNKRILGGLLTGAMVIGAIFGINKLNKKSEIENRNNDSITPTNVAKPATTATNSADTTIAFAEYLNLQRQTTIDLKPGFDTGKAKKNTYADILANKSSYYHQKAQAGQDTAQTPQNQTANSKIKTVKSTPVQVKTTKSVAVKAISPDTMAVFVDSNGIDSIQTPTFDTINKQSDTITNSTIDTIVASDSTTIISFSPVAIEDSVTTNNDTIINDSISSLLPNQVIANDSIVINNDTISNQLNPDEMPDGAFEKRKYKKHIAKCDSIMAVAFNGEEKRDEFYQKIYDYIDSGNFTPTPEMHLSEFATYLAIMQNISTDSTERRLAEDIFSGKKLTDKQQEYLDNLPKWNFSLPKRIEQMGVKFYLESSSKTSDEKTLDRSQSNTSSSYRHYQSRIKGNSNVACVSHNRKSAPTFKSNSQVLQKLYKAGRLS